MISVNDGNYVFNTFSDAVQFALFAEGMDKVNGVSRSIVLSTDNTNRLVVSLG